MEKGCSFPKVSPGNKLSNSTSAYEGFHEYGFILLLFLPNILEVTPWPASLLVLDKVFECEPSLLDD